MQEDGRERDEIVHRALIQPRCSLPPCFYTHLSAEREMKGQQDKVENELLVVV